MPLHPVVGAGRISLAVVICFCVGGVAADELPIDLVQIVGFQHYGADDPLSAGCFQPYLHFAEEDVEVRLDGGRVAFVFNGEFGAIEAVCYCSVCGVPRRASRRVLEVVCCVFDPCVLVSEAWRDISRCSQLPKAVSLGQVPFSGLHEVKVCAAAGAAMAARSEMEKASDMVLVVLKEWKH